MSLSRTKIIGDVSTLDLLLGELEHFNLTPGWIDRADPIVPPLPKSEFVPALWRYDEMKAVLDAASRLIDVRLAERRNLVMRNPFPGNDFATTNTLVAAYQVILPGEVARSHRHTANALRYIIDGKGTYSVVNGVKVPMETGDVVLTPGWFWHGHGHDGDQPAYWIDGLDVPLTHLLQGHFYENHPDHYEKIASVVTTSPFRFSRDSMNRALDQAEPDPDGFHGRRISLDAPDMPPMSLFMERLHAGEKTRRQRSTVNHVFMVAEGSGETIINAERFSWKSGDTVAIPMWNKYEHEAITDSLLFDMSDESLMRMLKHYRFEAD